MLNNLQGNDVVRECNRLNDKLTQRGFRRFTERLFRDSSELEIVFDLRAGESPKKSVFERMARFAEHNMNYALEDSLYLSLVEKKRSPKAGTITYRVKASFDNAGNQYHLNGVLHALKQVAEACAEVDIQGHSLFAV